MGTIGKYGVVLGLLVVAWTFVMGFTGWYRDPVLLNLFFMVVLFEIAVLYFALQKTAAEGRTYGKQVVAGILVAVVAAPIIFLGSILFTSVVFPSYFEEVRGAQETMLRESGMPEEMIRQRLDATAVTQTSVFNAALGAFMTILTAAVASAVIALFVRARPAEPPRAA